MSNHKRGNKISPAPGLKAVGGGDDGAGYLEGYLAVFNNVDLVGDRIIPGAFAKTIRERVPAGKVPLMVRHYAMGGDLMESVGSIIEAKEDETGLWIRAAWDADDESQAVRRKVAQRIEAGGFVGLSIGYRVIDAADVLENGKSVFELRELALDEGTITLRPANPEAYVTDAKSDSNYDNGTTAGPTLGDIIARIETLEARVTGGHDAAHGKSTITITTPPGSSLIADEAADDVYVESATLFLEAIKNETR